MCMLNMYANKKGQLRIRGILGLKRGLLTDISSGMYCYFHRTWRFGVGGEIKIPSSWQMPNSNSRYAPEFYTTSHERGKTFAMFWKGQSCMLSWLSLERIFHIKIFAKKEG